MGGQRTEPATPRRRQEARRKGQFARTAELGPAMVLLAVYGVLSAQGGTISELGQQLMKKGLQALAEPEALTPNGVAQLFTPAVTLAVQMVAPVMLAVMGVGVASHVAQSGLLLTALRVDWQRLNPLAGLQRMFSKRALVELVKSLLKVTLIGFMGYRAVQAALQEMPTFTSLPPWQAFAAGGKMAGKLAAQVGGTFLAFALFDYIYQRWEFEQSIRMTRKEVEDELKETEGDPQIRGKIRQRQRQMAMRRMMHEVPKADVVVTNPIHLAVALRYEAKKQPAPLVVAKGAGLLAERIKVIAREHRVPVVENVELAQALYHGVEVNSPIPAELYQAVAEVLAFVYRLKNKGNRSWQ